MHQVKKVELEMWDQPTKRVWAKYEIQRLDSYANWNGSAKDFFGFFEAHFVTCPQPTWVAIRAGPLAKYKRAP